MGYIFSLLYDFTNNSLIYLVDLLRPARKIEHTSSDKNQFIENFGVLAAIDADQKLNLNSFKFFMQNGLLKEFGNDINGKSEFGTSILHHTFKSPEVVEYLISSYPELKLDIKDDYGATPVHYAASANKLDSIILLHKAGADLSIKDSSNASIAITIAKDHKYPYRDLSTTIKYLIKESFWTDDPDYQGKKPLDYLEWDYAGPFLVEHYRVIVSPSSDEAQ
jgi:hypothetical protein